MEPDLGTAGVYVVVAVSIFFMAGANLLYLGAITGGVVGVAWLMIPTTGYQMERIRTFLDPFADPLVGLQHDPGAAGARAASLASGWERATRSSCTCRRRRPTSSSRSSGRSGASSAR